MSEYFFAVLSGQTLPGGKKAAIKRNRIAKRIDNTAGYVYYYDDARREWMGWGYCRNRGNPFDQQTSAEIKSAWEAAGV